MAITRIPGMAPALSRRSMLAIPAATAGARMSFPEKLAAAREQVRTDSASMKTKPPTRAMEANNTVRAITPQAPGTPVLQTRALRAAQPLATTGAALPVARRLRRRKTSRRGKPGRQSKAALAQIAAVFGAIYEVVLDADSGVVSVVLQEHGGATLTLGRQNGAWHLDVVGDDGVLREHEQTLKARFAQESLGPVTTAFRD